LRGKNKMELTKEMAEEFVKRMDDANQKYSELIERAEKFKKYEIVSGSADAGASKEKSPDEIKKEGMLNFFKGTAIERALQ
jgi:hypothetical protein